jgi:hypothetical protein
MKRVNLSADSYEQSAVSQMLTFLVQSLSANLQQQDYKGPEA